MSLYARYAALLDGVLDALEADGALPPDLPRKAVAVEPPRDASHGDLATNAAMVLAKGAGTNPRALAGLIAPKLEALPGVTEVAIAGPGVHQPASRRRHVADGAGRDPRARATPTAARTSARASGSMSNMSRPIRPGRCTWAIAAARWSAMRWRACSKRRASPSRANIMSTMPAARSIRSPARRTSATARRLARMSARSPRGCIPAII